MDANALWKEFEKSGRIADFLRYAECACGARKEQDCEALQRGSGDMAQKDD